MLADVIEVLADPIDGTALHGEDNFRRLVSESGHSYDVARQGYVTLSAGGGLKFSGDNPEMLQSREAFLSRGHFAPFVEAVTEAVGVALDEAEVPDDAHPIIMEVGAGTGYYLSHTLDTVLNSRGVGIDISIPAAKRLATCHSQVGAVAADVWSRLPLKDDSVDVITVVFAPRNPAEFARVLKPGGQVIVLSADVGHLAELREPIGIIDVEPGKVERMISQAADYLVPAAPVEYIEFQMELDQSSIASQIGMSPSARHISPEVLAARVAKLPPSMTVTARAAISRLALKPQD
ncbi:methyltransferase domain-containing protein [Corynebacterium caspium]|uniref:methyltransferase domain-containing protein n=1 Tax=Corynebacterium caspium TaxID=234828 RepID=UPI00036D0711|nr:methyltransferase domain-containing protein [Corynebacterium caspium]WKD59507.1 23S rRNA (guanine(748)-N(1))-methyltransferase [Corynebacterium caspium DSM 44850]